MTDEELGKLAYDTFHGHEPIKSSRVEPRWLAAAKAVADVIRDECKKAIRDSVDDDFDEEESAYDCGFREGQDVLSESACAVIDAAAQSADNAVGNEKGR